MIDIVADLRFGAGEPGPACLDGAWAAPEAEFTWSLGTDSRIVVPLPDRGGDLTAEMQVDAFVWQPGLPSQRLSVWLGTFFAGERIVDGPCILRFHLPDAARQTGDHLTVHLHLPDAAQPSASSLNSDTRRLGVALYRLMVLRSPAEPAPRPDVTANVVEADVSFGWGGNAAACLIDGWGQPEIGHSWALGRRSRLRLAIAHPGAAYTVLIEVCPLSTPSAVLPQRVIVGGNDKMVASFTINARRVVALPLPPAVTGPGTTELIVTFDNLDAAQPRAEHLYPDGRNLAFMLLTLRLIRTAALAKKSPPRRPRVASRDLQPAGLLSHFESLGHSCALGLVQRRHGVERQGLYRFAGSPTWPLIHGLINRFDQLGRPDSLSFFEKPPYPTYWLYESTYGISSHTPFRCDAGPPEPARIRSMSRRLRFLRRKFLEDVDEGQKIFVFHRPEPATREEVDAVVAALGLTTANTVLWVVSDGSVEPGTVARLGPRLLTGGANYLAVDDNDPNLFATDNIWLRMLGKALLLTDDLGRPRALPLVRSTLARDDPAGARGSGRPL